MKSLPAQLKIMLSCAAVITLTANCEITGAVARAANTITVQFSGTSSADGSTISGAIVYDKTLPPDPSPSGEFTFTNTAFTHTLQYTIKNSSGVTTYTQGPLKGTNYTIFTVVSGAPASEFELTTLSNGKSITILLNTPSALNPASLPNCTSFPAATPDAGTFTRTDSSGTAVFNITATACN